jgi:hypothetical protein
VLFVWVFFLEVDSFFCHPYLNLLFARELKGRTSTFNNEVLMKTLAIAIAMGALIVGSASLASAQEAKAAQEHPAVVHPDGHGGPGGGGRPGPSPVRPNPVRPDPVRPDPVHGGGGGGGDHPHPIPNPGPHPGPHPGPGGGPDRWHNPERNWGGWGAWNVFHGPWFWYGDSIVLVWDGAEYIQTVVYYDPDTDMYYWVDADGVSHWLN